MAILPLNAVGSKICQPMETNLYFTGEEAVGLCDYHARWYGSYITQFTQPDSIIPDPYNPQDWNRYAYARYNPIRYTDPSGHKACDSDDRDSCPYATDVSTFSSMLKMRYGINIINKSGSIGLEDIRTIYGAAYNMDKAFGGKFKETVGNSSFYYTRRTDGKYGGQWEGGSTVSIGSTIDGQYPAENLIHEFGHLIDNVLFGGEAGNVLGRNTITDSNGNFVMGIRGDGKYDRQTGLGYFKSCSATATACQTEQHPRAWEPKGNTGPEEWADMYMNYVQGTIDMNSPAGVTRSLYVQIFLYPLIH